MVIVTAESGTRAFKASRWVIGKDGALDVINGTELAASYPPGAWRSVHQSALVSETGDRERVR